MTQIIFITPIFYTELYHLQMYSSILQLRELTETFWFQ